MKKYTGISIFKGIASGKLKIYKRNDVNVMKCSITDTEAELKRFNDAKKVAAEQIEELYELAVQEVGDENAAIFRIHIMMLEDYSFTSAVENIITNLHYNAEYAVSTTGHSLYDMFLEMDDLYMQARSADIQDISERLLTILYGNSEAAIESDEPAIIIAEDLSPSETVRLTKGNIIAFATAKGSASSHTAILARTMKLPAIVGADMDILSNLNGKTALVDGYDGCIYIDPDERTIRQVERKDAKEKKKLQLYQKYKGKDNVTLDGKSIKIYANVGSMDEVNDAVENDAGGVGLFRSEFIYLDKTRFPTEDELFCVYKNVVDKMKSKDTMIRLLDIGAGKRMEYYGLPQEKNPALGCRGIRYLFTRPDVFKTQLKAIYRAASYGNVSVLYPMIATLVDIGRILNIDKEAREELDAQHIPYGNIRHGALIETPSAVMISDLIAREMDFVSIGTNDLAQYTMAIDRENAVMKDFFDPVHISLFRMIKMVIDNTHRYKKEAYISGEIGSYTSLTQLFLALGADGLSVTPTEILPLRQVVCTTDLSKISQDELTQLWS